MYKELTPQTETIIPHARLSFRWDIQLNEAGKYALYPVVDGKRYEIPVVVEVVKPELPEGLSLAKEILDDIKVEPYPPVRGKEAVMRFVFYSSPKGRGQLRITIDKYNYFYALSGLKPDTFYEFKKRFTVPNKEKVYLHAEYEDTGILEGVGSYSTRKERTLIVDTIEPKANTAEFKKAEVALLPTAKPEEKVAYYLPMALAGLGIIYMLSKAGERRYA